MLLSLLLSCQRPADPPEQADEYVPKLLDGYFGLPWGTPCVLGEPLVPTCDGGEDQGEWGTWYECTQEIAFIDMTLLLHCEGGVFTAAHASKKVGETDVQRVDRFLRAVWGDPYIERPDNVLWDWDNARAGWLYGGGELRVLAFLFP